MRRHVLPPLSVYLKNHSLSCSAPIRIFACQYHRIRKLMSSEADLFPDHPDCPAISARSLTRRTPLPSRSQRRYSFPPTRSLRSCLRDIVEPPWASPFQPGIHPAKASPYDGSPSDTRTARPISRVSTFRQSCLTPTTNTAPLTVATSSHADRALMTTNVKSLRFSAHPNVAAHDILAERKPTGTIPSQDMAVRLLAH
jgi:hypothetical protein